MTMGGHGSQQTHCLPQETGLATARGETGPRAFPSSGGKKPPVEEGCQPMPQERHHGWGGKEHPRKSGWEVGLGSQGEYRLEGMGRLGRRKQAWNQREAGRRRERERGHVPGKRGKPGDTTTPLAYLRSSLTPGQPIPDRPPQTAPLSPRGASREMPQWWRMQALSCW